MSRTTFAMAQAFPSPQAPKRKAVPTVAVAQPEVPAAGKGALSAPVYVCNPNLKLLKALLLRVLGLTSRNHLSVAKGHPNVKIAICS